MARVPGRYFESATEIGRSAKSRSHRPLLQIPSTISATPGDRGSRPDIVAEQRQALILRLEILLLPECRVGNGGMECLLSGGKELVA